MGYQYWVCFKLTFVRMETIRVIFIANRNVNHCWGRKRSPMKSECHWILGSTHTDISYLSTERDPGRGVITRLLGAQTLVTTALCTRPHTTVTIPLRVASNTLPSRRHGPVTSHRYGTANSNMITVCYFILIR